MRQKFLQTIFAIAFLLQDIGAQSILTKPFFYNLPIEQSEAAVINSIKSDTSLFKVADLNDISSFMYSFDAKLKKHLTLIPSSSEMPTIKIYDVKVFVDSVLKLKMPTIRLRFVYENNRKAKKAYSIITNKIKSDYKTFKDHDCRMENAKIKCNEKRLECFTETEIGPMTFPTCEVWLTSNDGSEIWTVSLTYKIKKS